MLGHERGSAHLAGEGLVSRGGLAKELLHRGALSSADMIDIIKTQQIELNEMKKENTLLKSKIVKAANAGYKF